MATTGLWVIEFGVAFNKIGFARIKLKLGSSPPRPRTPG